MVGTLDFVKNGEIPSEGECELQNFVSSNSQPALTVPLMWQGVDCFAHDNSFP
jgi:hypothetical protein